MPAHFIPVGEPAHDTERQALRFLVEGLPNTYAVYGNPWLVERSGVVYELDAVVVAPHAVLVVEIKSYRGAIEGNDHDWYVPHPIPSPLKRNRKTAQVLASLLRRESYKAGQAWVEGFIFLSSTVNVGVRGPASNDRIHTRKTILDAIQDENLVKRLARRQVLTPTEGDTESEVLRLLTGAKQGPGPTRRIREYTIIEALDHQETFTEYLAHHTLLDRKARLRVYGVPHLATDTQRERIRDRARWEAQVLARLGRSPGILSADPPFADEAGIAIPFEHFEGITLTTWLERYGPQVRGKKKADLQTRTNLWLKLAQTLQQAHEQGVVHRLLRPEVVLIEDEIEPVHLRVTSFDLAKQLSLETTISLTTVSDERLRFAAPEVVNAFSSAEPASDQFGLGVLLALILTGRPLFESTRALMATGRLVTRVRDASQRIPLGLDEAVARMLALRPPDRYPTLEEAIEAVKRAREPQRRRPQPLFHEQQTVIDPDDLKKGMRLGPDYEIISRLGRGGMAVVYAARHLVSGRTRALKIARAQSAAEEALQGEYQALVELDHPNLVRVIDLSKMVEGRLTLVMERVGGQNLRHWLAENPAPDSNTQRRFAEDLLAGLDHLEQQGVVHKDLKPDNLIVGDGGLTILDFSLAKVPSDALYCGTALYRDPAATHWGPATDRYAAALCLFELFTGRHAFDGRVPEPDQHPSVDEQDIDPPGLAAFFRKALHPSPEQRFGSARAMRDALLVALGAEVELSNKGPGTEQLEASTPLRLTGLSRRAVNQLARSRVLTVGELLALAPHQVRSIHAIGRKTASEILEFQAGLREQGLVSVVEPASSEPPIVPELSTSPEPLSRLSLPAAVASAIEAHGIPTVGALAGLTRSQLLAVEGIGRGRLVQIVEGLHRFRDHTPDPREAHTLDRIWDLASRPLADDEREALERVVGLKDDPCTQAEVAQQLDASQPQVSALCSRAMDRLDVGALTQAQVALEQVLDSMGGVARAIDVAERLESAWPGGLVRGSGLMRLIVRVSGGRLSLMDLDGVDGGALARPIFDRPTLRAFVHETTRLASLWPPQEPGATRRALAALLPHYQGDPLALAVRLCVDVDYTDAGHLFIHPLQPSQSIGFVLERERNAIEFAELKARVRRMFGPDCPFPDRDHLLELLRELGYQRQGDRIVPDSGRSVTPSPALEPDQVPIVLGAERSPEEVVRDMLKDAVDTRGFRMLVTPPERHAEIGPSVAAALGGHWISFEDAFFEMHGGDISSLERAERFTAQRYALNEATEDLMERLLEEHGRPGNTVVLGDTALLGLCDALDLPRRLYDETLSGGMGFWVLVVPGVIHRRQPRFNEGPPLWHLEGATLPLLRPLPGSMP